MAKQNKTRKSRGRFVLGVLVGIAIGAAVAILFMPPLSETDTEVASDDLFKRGQARYQQLAVLVRERYGDALALGQEAYSRTKDELLTRYTQTKAGE